MSQLGGKFLSERALKKQFISSEGFFRVLCATLLVIPLALLGAFFIVVLIQAWPRFSFDFLVSFPSRKAELAGIFPALIGSVFLMILTALMAIPIGVGAAIYLEEYARPSRLTSMLELNISNLAGVPSIIYGLLGLEVFVRVLRFDRSLLAGAGTLALLVLPMVIMTTREALRTVPHALREASFALGAGKWRTIRHVILPLSMPGILTSIILSLARAIGETAPLITIGALTYIAFLPDSVYSPFTALPIQIFNWASRPQAEFQHNAAAGIVVLLLAMLLFNGGAIWLRNRLQKRLH